MHKYFQHIFLFFTTLLFAGIFFVYGKDLKIIFLILFLLFYSLNVFIALFLKSKKVSSPWLIHFGWTVAMFIVANLLFKERVWNYFIFDNETGWKALPNLRQVDFSDKKNFSYLVSTDEYGNRNTFPYPRDNRIGVIVQGASISFGYGLRQDETFTEILSKKINQSVYNFSASGYDINNFYFQYKKFAEKFSFKSRVIVFGIGKDLTTPILSTPFLMKRPYLEVQDGEVIEVTSNVGRIKKQVYGYKFTDKYKSYNHLVKFNGAGRDWGDSCPDWLCRFPVVPFIFSNVFRILVQPIATRNASKGEIERAGFLQPFYPDWLIVNTKYWPEPYRIYLEDFKLIFKKIVEQNKNLTIVLIPARIQVLEANKRAAVARLRKNFEMSAIDVFSVNKFISSLAKENNVKVVDCTLPLQKAKNKEALFQEGDDHFTAESTELCVQEFLRTVQARVL